PKAAAIGSPGTMLVRLNVTIVTPSSSRIEVPRRRSRYPASGEPAGDRRFVVAAVVTASVRRGDLGDIDRPGGVVIDTGDGRGGGDVRPGNNQRDERPLLLH